MENRQRVKHSLRRELIYWTTIITVVISVIGGIITGITSYFEARDVQDDVLKQIAHLVTNSDIETSQLLRFYEKDTTIVVQALHDSENEHLDIPRKQPDGLDTISSHGDSWRVFITRHPNNDRFLVAQQTDLRNEAALSAAMSAVLPIGILAVILLILMSFMITIRLKPIHELSRFVDNQKNDHLKTLPLDHVPEEISPFIAAINRLLGRTQETINQQRRFIADASHELRTPITALSLVTDNLEDDPSESSRKHKVGQLRQGLDRMHRLVEQLLNLARLQNKTDDQADIASFETIVRDVVERLYPIADAKHIDLGMVETSDVSVHNIQNSLTQLVENALGNAIHYTPEHGQIDIHLSKIGNHAVLAIHDSGPGIPEQDIDKVLSPFFRSTNHEQSGNGLGLAICQEVAERHHGQISIKNNTNGGLIFSYRQPIAATVSDQ